MKVGFTDGTTREMDVVLDLQTIKKGDNVVGTSAFKNPTVYNYQETTVAAAIDTYYVLGRYTELNLRGNGIGYVQYEYKEIAFESLDIGETYYYITKDGYQEVVVAAEKANVNAQTQYYRRYDVKYYTFEEVSGTVGTYSEETTTTYYIKSDDSYIPVQVSNGYKFGNMTYYTRKDAVDVSASTKGTFYTYSEDASNRHDYVAVESLNTSSPKYNAKEGYKYYMLSITNDYTVTAYIGAENPALKQSIEIKIHIFAEEV